jgi:periplasmic copper chaperone A
MKRTTNLPSTATSSMNPDRRRGPLVLVGFVALGVSAVTVGTAQAHIGPKPSVVTPGAKTEVSFTVGHGCGASPTTKLQIKIPDGVTVSVPRGPATMVSSIAGKVVTFDGEAGGKTQKVFLTVQFPKTRGVLTFPIVQTCKTGKASWIDVPNAANPKPKYPAPQITVK